MAFIISKKTKRRGKEFLFYYFVENYREGNKIKRGTIFKLRLSPSLYDYLGVLKKREAWFLSILAYDAKKLKELMERGKLHPDSIYINRGIERLGKKVQSIKTTLEECKQIQEKVRSYL